ncbi:MAG: Tex family protein [Erysipelotrichaceae bacterium]|nr:Tex family protein [Erysipelotrichaceae bacterium]MDD3809590.1 Tex family protein [Erysipelotrichaceae bacterium]
MNENIIKQCTQELNITTQQVKAVLSLLEDGATVPFIARYRKEVTGGLDEDQIREIDKYYQYQVSLLARKEDVVRLIDEKGMLDKQLQENIMKATTLAEVEDYYRPYKEKRKTRATEAKKRGLEPLALYLLSLPQKGNVEKKAAEFINDEVGSADEALNGAMDIIAEIIADDIKYRKSLKETIYRYGFIVTKEKSKNPDEDKVFEMYYDYREKVQYIVAHRILAINRAESEKVISVNVEIDKEKTVEYIYNGLTRRRPTIAGEYIHQAIQDCYTRLLFPSIVREVRNELSEKAQEQALKVFSVNLESLLLQAPLKGKFVLGVDPGYRTGCKLAVVDPTGKVLAIDKAFITLPKYDYQKDIKTLLRLIKNHNVELIAIGNGTGSRESESFIAKLIKDNKLDVDYAIVSEAGASVYSASPLAKEEFPDYQVEERSAVSIARRLQDPLGELVKIEPRSISVGQYQHDMPAKQLDEQLEFVVTKAVNNVGVDINTASFSLLSYVAGISKNVAKNIVNYRDEFGRYKNRDQIKKVPKLGPKTYEQAVGFLRINDGDNPLDKTGIHPENYTQAKALLQVLKADVNDIGTDLIKEKLQKTDLEETRQQLAIDKYTFEEIVESFKKPNRSIRDEYPTPLLKKDILSLEDLRAGMVLEGTVRNVVDFGAFVDIGLKNDGLVHKSQLPKRVSHPLDIVNIGDIVKVKVLEIDSKKKRVALTMKD